MHILRCAMLHVTHSVFLVALMGFPWTPALCPLKASVRGGRVIGCPPIPKKNVTSKSHNNYDSCDYLGPEAVGFRSPHIRYFVHVLSYFSAVLCFLEGGVEGGGTYCKKWKILRSFFLSVFIKHVAHDGAKNI